MGRESVKLQFEELMEGNEGSARLFETCRVVKLWVEMHPNVVLLVLLEVEDEAWFFMIAVQVIEEEVNLLRTESTCSKDELDSMGGSFSLKPKKVVETHGATREHEIQL